MLRRLKTDILFVKKVVYEIRRESFPAGSFVFRPKLSSDLP